MQGDHAVARDEVDAYLAAVPEPQRGTLMIVRARILDVLHDPEDSLTGRQPEECITYGIPTVKVEGRSIAGYAAYTRHCSYFPMSGAVLGKLEAELVGYITSRGTLRFAVDAPLSAELVRQLVRARQQDVLARGR